MAYLGNSPTSPSSVDSFRLLDDIKTYTFTFNGASPSVVSTSNDAIVKNDHRFLPGQKVTYTNGGGSDIGGLANNTSYYIIKQDENTIKLATSASNAASATAINITAVGGGTAHTLKVAFDGYNTKFKASFDNGRECKVTRAAQLTISINGVVQQPHDTSSPTSGYGFDNDSAIVFSTAPSSSDVFWGYVLANNYGTYDASDNKVDNFTGNGSVSSFTLSKTPPTNESVLVTIDGVIQYPSDATTTRSYSLSENVVDFTGTPANGAEIQVRHIGFAGASTSAVSSFQGRTGAVALRVGDNLVGVGIQSGGTNIGIGVTLLNFVGLGNTFLYNSGTHTVDVSIAGGVGAGGTWGSDSVGVNTTKMVGIGTSAVGAATSEGILQAVGNVTILDGALITDQNIDTNITVPTGKNGLLVGPVTVGAGKTIDVHVNSVLVVV